MTDGNAEPEISDSLKTFGEVVKTFRKRARLTQEEFARRVRYSVQTVASIEQGRRFPSAEFVERAEEVLDAFGVIRAAAKHVARQPGLASWFQKWAKLEAEALCLYTYENRLIPGLLQIELYARTLFEGQLPPLDDDEIQEKLVARVERQKLLTERPNTAYSFIIEEHVLRKTTGGPETHRTQIEHILRMSEQRNIEMQVMPLSREHHAGLDGPMQLLETPDNRWFGYGEGQRAGLLFADAKEVGILKMRYARMRSQALTLEDSQSLLRQMRGAT
ncbi:MULTISPECIES: helix-turn-helix domain-containing protein [Streptomyces]|uniref:helix-turn-helix domain-containing protein n=1 Tax=Streptomyces TaxID=1883 RepID=UPI0013166A3C|nr:MULTISPECIES: helix-turn-helix transcriptional regulator [Streptomyces]QGZ51546.1 helix-turn-helix domain-containing protein [Streptomyces sp. QHH-9511]GGT98259.1 transcriptional regulator [Streptomyces lateritius]